jgi:hypothetical protein
MNRTVIVAAALAVVLIGAFILLRDGGPAPAPAADAGDPAPAPRVVPKKKSPATVAEGPRKAAPKKAEPKAEEKEVAPPAPTLASLSLQSDVPGASVFIDRRFVGNTPLKLDNLEPGPTRVQLTATGFDSIQRTIELNPGPNNITLRVKEVSLNARANVVHKHGMGSCEGTLTASLEGLRYVTSHREDGFSLSYGQLETFTVDYLDKNLRVKQRGGKTWNFTNNDADVLFVFHRDVESARKKLAAGYSPSQ